MRNLLLVILLLFSAASFGQDLECKKFKNGKFQIIDSEIGNSYIERKGSKQLEYGGESKLKLEFKVQWLNECSYTLELTNILENPNQIPLPEDMILTVKIIETKEHSYIIESTSNMYDMVLKSELFEIE